jgi:hypothetical protein
MTTVKQFPQHAVLAFAFSLAKSTSRAEAQLEALNQLQARFSHIDRKELEEHLFMALRLSSDCYEAGVALYDDPHCEAQRLSWLRERHPGFSEETYRDALVWGHFISR